VTEPVQTEDFEPTHRVVGPLAIVPLPGGQQIYIYKDGVLPEVPDETIEHLTQAGLIAPIDEDPPSEDDLSEQDRIKEIIARQPDRVEQAQRSGGDVERSGPAPAGLPSRSASKGAWVDYATSQGMSRTGAESMSRDELADHYAPAR
jgi:hypothetical protein